MELTIVVVVMVEMFGEFSLGNNGAAVVDESSVKSK